MGASASLSPVETSTALQNAQKEIKSEYDKGNLEQAAFLAQNVLEHSSSIEESLHNLLCIGEKDACLKAGRCLVDIARATGVHSKEYLESLNMLCTLYLVNDINEICEEMESTITEAFQIASGQSGTGGGKRSIGYAIVLMNYYSFRVMQHNSYDAEWASHELSELLRKNERANDEEKFSENKIRYRIQNLALIYQSAGKETEEKILRQQETDLLGAELHDNPVIPEDTEYLSVGSISRHESKVESEISPSNSSLSRSYFGDNLSESSKSPSSSSFSQSYFGESSSLSVDEWDTIEDTSVCLNEIATLLFECIPYCELGDENVDSAAFEAINSCEGTDMIETLTAINGNGNSLLVQACREKKPKIVHALLNLAKSKARGIGLDLTPQLLGQRNALKLTPLHIACKAEFSCYDIVDLLLQAGGAASAYATDRDGCCPIHYAASAGDPNVIALLLLHGATPLQMDKRGFSAIDYCDPTNTECFNLLYNPQEENDEESPNDSSNTDDFWERRVDTGSKRVYFINLKTKEIQFNVPGNEDKVACGVELSDEDLLNKFREQCWLLGLQTVLKQREKQAAQYSLSLAKAKLLLLRSGEKQKQSLLRKLAERDYTIDGLEQHLKKLLEDKTITADKLDRALSQLADERNARGREHEIHKKTTNQLACAQETLDASVNKLHGEQKLREDLTLQLSEVISELSKLQQQYQSGKSLTEEQKILNEELNKQRESLTAQLLECKHLINGYMLELEELENKYKLTSDQLAQIQLELRGENALRIASEKLSLELQARLEALDLEMKSLRDKTYQQDEKIGEMESELELERMRRLEEEKMRQKELEKVEQATNQIKSLSGLLNQEQIQREEKEVELQNVQAELLKLAEESKKSGQQNEKLQAELEARAKALQDEMEKRLNELEALRAALENAYKVKEDAEAELNSLKDRLIEEQRLREKADRELEGMAFRLDAASGEMNALLTSLEKEQLQREKATSELVSVQRKLKQLNDALEQSKDNSLKDDERLKRLEDERDELELKMQDSEDILSELEKQLKSAKTNHNDALSDLETTQRRLELEQERSSKAKLEVGDLKMKLKALEDQRRLDKVQLNIERGKEQMQAAFLEAEKRKLEEMLSKEREEKVREAKRADEIENGLLSAKQRLELERQRVADIERRKQEELDKLKEQLEIERKRREDADEELRRLKNLEEKEAREESEYLKKRLKQEQTWRQEAVDELTKSKEALTKERWNREKETEDEMKKLQERLEIEGKLKENEMQKLQERLAMEEKVKEQNANQLKEMKAEMEALSTQYQEIKNRSEEDLELKRKIENKEMELNAQTSELENELRRMEEERRKLYEEFIEEQALRKQYYNEVEDLKGRIRVSCRIRPLSTQEVKEGFNSSLTVEENNISFTQHGKNGRSDRTVQFAFDKCFNAESTQDDVFKDVKRLVQSSVDGYNVCIFAYGQRGSGKTYTLFGSQEAKESRTNEGKIEINRGNEGIATRAISEIFRVMKRDEQRFKFELSMYCVEIYQNELIDLLHDPSLSEKPQLSVHLDSQGVVYVDNITLKRLSSAGQALQLLNSAVQKRKTMHTKWSSDSSRSHLISSIVLKATSKSSGVTTSGKLTLVDLAGSESASKLEAGGENIKEAKVINQSLLALGNVIQALTTFEKHVPYRNNLLTQLMADSIGGNAKTLMFVCVSPADLALMETKESLRWATRVKEVTNKSNKNSETRQIKALKAQIEKLKKSNSFSPAKTEQRARKPSVRHQRLKQLKKSRDISKQGVDDGATPTEKPTSITESKTVD